MINLIPGVSFVHKYFTPENRLAEVMCGLVMVLSFTATTSAAFEGTTPHALLIAVLGCNIAWGVVDGVTYILGNLLTRGTRARLIAQVKHTPDHPEANAVVQQRLQDLFGDLLTPEQRSQVHAWAIDGASRVEVEKPRIRREDIYTALACFMIVFGAALPLLVPFLLISNETLALRVANGLILVMLFVIGWRWAQLANLPRLKTALALLTLGLILVAITIVLGG